jgi:hypothetical protein
MHLDRYLLSFLPPSSGKYFWYIICPFFFLFPSLSFNVSFTTDQRPQSCMFFGSSISSIFLYSQISQYARITQSRITTFFFIFSLIYCCAQIILQSFLLSVDSKYAYLLSGIIEAGNLPPANFTYLQGKKGHINLQMCDDIPFGRVHPCTTIYDSTSDLIRPQVLDIDNWGKNLTVISILSPFNATQIMGVQIRTGNGSAVNLNEHCVQILLYPSQLYVHHLTIIPIIHIVGMYRLHNFTDEDTTSLCLQIWLLGISFIVILYDSVPHM